MRSSAITRATATGDVTTHDSYLRAVTLTADAAAATAVVRAGGASGTVILTVTAPANTTQVVSDLHDAFCGGGIHLTLTGAAAEASVVYS